MLQHTAAGQMCLCVCVCQQTHCDDVVKIITLLTIAPGTFLFSKIMNRIDDGSWNAFLHWFSSSLQFLRREELSGLSIYALAMLFR